MKIPVIIIAAAAIAVIASVSFFSQIEYNKSPCTYCPEIPSPNQTLKILDITTEPAIVSIGNSFLIYADVSNPNPYSVYLKSGCASPLSATFDKNVETKQGISCFAMSKEEVKPGQEIRILGPSIGTIYNATSVGLTNAVITLTYQIQGITETITSSKQITISYPAAFPSQIVSSNNNSTVENNLGNEIGIMAVGNGTYHFDALNDTTIAYHNDPVQISFHDVVFTLFPHPFSVGPPGSCGGTGFGTDAKFPDGIHELLGIFVQDMPCLGNSTPTNLSNHANPQAGLIFYDGKIRLLVSIENKSKQNVANISNSILVTNTNFTINYNITGDNKLLNAVLDSKVKTLELSLQASSNGTLTVTVPRALLDAKTNNGQDDMFILLIDGRETNYMQTTSSLDRTITIPFEQGKMKIEIIATQII